MFKKFINERSGAFILEWVIILASIGAIATVVVPKLMQQSTLWEGTTNGQFNQALSEDELTPVVSGNTQEPLAKPIINMFPSNGPYTTATEFQFSASTYGGAPPYQFTWTNYNGGQSDGEFGDYEKYAAGNQAVSVTVKDANGNEVTSDDVVVNVKNSIDFNIVAKKSDGSAYSPPYDINQPIKFEAIPSSSSGTVSCTWTGDYSGNSDCSGVSVNYSDPKVVNVSVKMCDSNGLCDTKAQTFAVGDAPIQANIQTDKSNTINDSTPIRFKVNASGGSGNYNISWNSYNGSPNNDSFGPQETYNTGSKAIKVTVCDNNKPSLTCATDTFNLTVNSSPSSFNPVQVSVMADPGRSRYFDYEDIRFKAIATGGNGSYNITWTNYSGSNSSDTWGSTRKYTQGNHQITAQACDTGGNCGTQTYTFDVVNYDPLNVTITPSITRDIYDVERIRFKADVSGGSGYYKTFWTNYSGANNTPGNWGTDVNYPIGDQTVTFRVCDEAAPNSLCTTKNYNFKVKDYKPIVPNIESSPSKSHYTDQENINHRGNVTGGSGSYTLTWNNFSNGNSSEGKWGTALKYPIGNQTVDVTACDAIVTSQPCVTDSRTFSVTSVVTASMIMNPNKPYVTTNESIRFKVDASGGSGPYIVKNWSGGYSGSSSENTYGGTKKFTTGNKTITATVCDANNSTNCKTVSKSFNVSTPISANLIMDPNKDYITYEEDIRFKVDGSGGTGSYVVRNWSGYSGSSSENTYAATTRYSPTPNQTVSAEICDTNNPSNCMTVSKTFEVTFRVSADIIANVKGTSTDLSNIDSITIHDEVRFKVTAINGTGNYTVSSWNKYNGINDVNKYGSYQKYPEGRYGIQVQVCDSLNSFNCKVFNETMDSIYEPIEAYIVSSDGDTVFEDQNVGFKVIASKGSKNYDISWSGYQGYGSTFNNTYSSGITYLPGNYTITSTVCDADFPSKPCKVATYDLTVNRAFIEFDGVNDFLDLRKYGDLGERNNSMTLEARINITGYGGGSPLIERTADDGNEKFSLFQGGKGAMGSNYKDYPNRTNKHSDITSNNIIPLNRYTLLTWVVDSSANQLRYYVDGTKVDTIPLYDRNPYESGEKWIVGKDIDGDFDGSGNFVGTKYNDYFKGKLNEYRVWNDARSDAEVASYSNRYLNGNESNLHAYYQMKRSYYNWSSIPDLSGNGRIAVPNNF